MSKMTNNLRPQDLRNVIRFAATALAVSQEINVVRTDGTRYVQPCLLEAMSELKGLSVTANYAVDGAGEAAGRTAAEAAKPAINIPVFELMDSIREECKAWAERLGLTVSRNSELILALSNHAAFSKDRGELEEIADLLCGWAVGIEKLMGSKEPDGWGWPCPACGSLHLDDEVHRMAPLFSGNAVRKGDAFAYCTQCNFLMTTESLTVRTSRNIRAALNGSSRLAQKWGASVRSARGKFVKARSDDWEAREAAVKTLTWLGTSLLDGRYFAHHATAEEKAAVKPLPAAA